VACPGCAVKLHPANAFWSRKADCSFGLCLSSPS